jgi:trk system potassium uptake protein TrkA
MQIIILGDNEVAKGLTETLCNEDHDVTLVGEDADKIEQLKERFDIRTITGSPSYPNILRQAGAEDADMLIAVTDNDEVNMIACEVAHALYHTPTKVARIRALEYLDKKNLFGSDVIAIDVCISPEKMVTDHISRLIEYPGATQVYDFAEGKVRMVLLKPYYGGVLIGKALREIKASLPNIAIRVVAIFRQRTPLELTADTIIETGDELLFLCHRENIRTVMKAFGREDRRNNRIMIAGGGNIGFRLAQSLEAKYQVKIIEHNEKRANYVANDLSNTTVLHGDVSDKKLLLDENIENMDVFCAVTNDDEANIMSCMQAKRLGVRQVMALVKRFAYVELIEGSEIDIAISPQQITVGSILAHIRKGDITKVYSLPNNSAEILEIIAHGDPKTSKVVGKAIKQVKLPHGTLIAGLVRGDNDLLLVRDTVIEAEDRVIVFVENSKRVSSIEKLFQVSATFV